MTLTPAMDKAQELHPARTMPKRNPWENSADAIEAFQVMNRIRISLLDDDWPKKVLAFHRLYKMPGGDGPIRQLDPYRRVLRRRLLAEEVRETNEADERGDLVETIDGLLDTIYVAIGWMLELGMTPRDINMAMEEIHASNMTKVDENGKPVFDDGGKVLKGDNYVRANLALVLDLPSEMEPSDGQADNSMGS